MTDNAMSAFEDPLHRVAVDLILPTGLDVEMAVTLAEDMVASGVGDGATVAVATLARDSWVSDAEQPVREMLAEHGIDVPLPPTTSRRNIESSCGHSAIGACPSAASRDPFTFRSLHGTTKGR